MNNLPASSSLTPIRIRGKKRVKDSRVRISSSNHASLNIHRSVTAPSKQEPTIRTKRPASGFKSLPPPILCHDMESKKGLSRLESLPPEILQQIFLYTCNPFLPRASPLIGVKLSTPYVYREFCKKVFDTVISSCFPGWNGGTVDYNTTFEEIGTIRTEALKSRWLTWEMYQAHQTYMSDWVCKNADGDVIRDMCVNNECHNSCEMQICLGKGVCIPRKLLKYPYQGASNFEYLRALVYSGAVIDLTGSLDYELAGELWWGAAVSHNYPLVHLLMRHQIYTPAMGDIDAVQEIGGHDFGLAWLLCHDCFPALQFRDVHYLEHYSEIPRSARWGLANDPACDLDADSNEYLLKMKTRLQQIWMSSRPEDKTWARTVREITAHLYGLFDVGLQLYG